MGVTALTFGGAVLPASADDSAEPVELNITADKYELAAARTGDSAAEIEAKETAELISVSDQGFFYYVDEAHESHGLSLFNLPQAEGAPIPSTPAAGSRPGAPVTVYLDFDGETLTGTQWNAYAEIPSLAFAAGTVPDKAAVWAAVSEDYAPFNVNVTTTRPSPDALYKTSIGDNEYGAHVIITDSYTDVLPAAAGSGGIAWVNAVGSEYMSGALVFTEGSGGDAKKIAEIASHESGHNFGLGHDGIAGSTDGEYYIPTQGLWAPIMGAGYYTPVTQWSAGGYAGATNTQDDLATITDRDAAAAYLINVTLSDGTPYEGRVCVLSGDPANPQPGDQYRASNPDGTCDPIGELLTLNFTYTDRANYAADTVGDTPATAAVLDNADDTFEAASVIETTTDVDVFVLTTIGGELTAQVSVAEIGPNLDAKLTLTNAAGAIVAENDPAAARVSISTASGLNASISETGLAAGAYYLSVEGVGTGDPSTATPDNANGYVKYGSLGNFTLSGTADATDPIVIETPADGAAVAGASEIDVTGTATPGAQVTLTIAGTVVDTVTADSNGDWAAAVTVGQYGNTVITASQTIDGIEIAGTDSVTVTAPPAPVAAPVITTPGAGSTTGDTTPTIGGTGVAGATVIITVRNADGKEVFAEALVAADGTWSVDLTGALADGTYTVVAVQSLGGITSDDSAAVAFTVAAAPGGTGGNGDGNGNGGDSLATTGGDFNATPFAAMAGVLLLIGAGLAVYARRKHLSSES
ncbi:Ig-like domain-containing protein [Microbacterium sp. A196]|uniref:Ig-like domain-containing protein n=1 Tax=Microbacterium sp. A196 TaxID=3457320 RepID=UPI003FCFF9DC